MRLQLSAFRQPETQTKQHIVKKDDWGDLECSLMVAARQAGLSISENAGLLEILRHCYL